MSGDNRKQGVLLQHIALPAAIISVALGVAVGLPEYFFRAAVSAIGVDTIQTLNIIGVVVKILFGVCVAIPVLLAISQLSGKGGGSAFSMKLPALFAVAGIILGLSPLTPKVAIELWKQSNPPNYEFVMELLDTEWDGVSDIDRADIVSLWSRELKKWGHYYEPSLQEDGTIVLRSHVRSDVDLFFLRNQLRYGYVSMHLVQEESGDKGREYEMRFSDERKRLEIPPILSGRFIENATEINNSRYPAISVTINEKSGNLLRQVTSSSVGRKLAVVVSGQIISVATIQEPVGKRFQITGLDDIGDIRERAALLANLSSGGFPQPVRIITETRL